MKIETDPRLPVPVLDFERRLVQRLYELFRKIAQAINSGSDNGPVASAYNSTTQTITGGVMTRVNLDTKETDTAGVFDTAQARFKPNVAGWYQVYGQVRFNGAGTALNIAIVSIYKNGAELVRGQEFSYLAAGFTVQVPASQLVYFNGSTDYVELWARGDGPATVSIGFADSRYANRLQAYMVRAAG